MTLVISQKPNRLNWQDRVDRLTEKPEESCTLKLVCRWFPTGKNYPKMEAYWVFEPEKPID